jgi:hypothetical protein
MLPLIVSGQLCGKPSHYCIIIFRRSFSIGILPDSCREFPLKRLATGNGRSPSATPCYCGHFQPRKAAAMELVSRIRTLKNRHRCPTFENSTDPQSFALAFRTNNLTFCPTDHALSSGDPAGTGRGGATQKHRLGKDYQRQHCFRRFHRSNDFS